MRQVLGSVLLTTLITTVAQAQTILTATPGSLSFGNQAVSTTSTSRTVTLRNAGNTSLTVSDTAVSGDFSKTDACGTLPPGVACTISISFTPTAVGSRTGTLTITDSAIGSPHTVPLAGFGVDFAFMPSSLSFGNVHTGTAAMLSTTLTN